MSATGGAPRTTSRAFLLNAIKAKNGYTMADMWEHTCDLYADRPAFQYVGCERYPEKKLTFREMDGLANQIARWATAQEGLVKGDTVALYMDNRIEYVAFWLGLSKIGVKTAFINNTIKKNPLVHSIVISEAKLVIFGAELDKSIFDVSRELIRKHGIEPVCSGGASMFARSIDGDIFKHSPQRPDRSLRDGVRMTDVFGYIYTSGTTGLPKAVNVTHIKQWAFAAGYKGLISETDVAYHSGMPLYHSSAGGIGIGFVFHFGCQMVIRPKFSANRWLADVRKYGVTVFQYIGELCRYIHAQPPTSQDSDTKLRLGTGNGLSKEIWVDFQKRFKIEKIREFYGSTEGNGAFKNVVSLDNLLKGDYSGVGCIGSVQNKNQMGARFVKYDINADELVRDADGNLQDCAPEEPGECLFVVRQDNPITSFVGYTDKKASQKKMVEDKGKHYFRTGDLLMETSDGFVKFIDRIGDTFRWRGENVSTFECASELSKCPTVQEANVYGVQVPHVEGRAGMASIVFRPSAASRQQALAKLLSHAQGNLPSYSVPVFVRVQNEVQTTQTFKHQKVQLRKEGIDPQQMGGDDLYWLHPDKKSYEPFTMEDYVQLQKPNVRSKL
mmetsp:Transcript_20425/g.36322  ORF Transcript_20425/g.36322 Transcript_20425/m.36322 type:complete len:612 (+) Transcript_20425:109-1944(+)